MNEDQFRILLERVTTIAEEKADADQKLQRLYTLCKAEYETLPDDWSERFFEAEAIGEARVSG